METAEAFAKIAVRCMLMIYMEQDKKVN